MKNKYDEDLFAGTTMTFGEHLEELRGALFRACWAWWWGRPWDLSLVTASCT